MNDLEHLKATRELLAEPDHWTQGGYAMRAPHRRRVRETPPIDDTEPVQSPYATCFCLQGAWAKTGNVQYSPSHAALDRLLAPCLPEQYRMDYPENPDDPNSPMISDGSTVGFNDAPGREHSEVLAVLDCAISRLEGETK